MSVLFRALRAVFALIVLVGVALVATPAQAATAAPAASYAAPSALGADCEVESDAANCDIDRDRIPDVVDVSLHGGVSCRVGATC